MFIHSLSIHNPQAVWIKFWPKNFSTAASIESFASLFNLADLEKAPVGRFPARLWPTCLAKALTRGHRGPESFVGTDETLFLNPGVRPGWGLTCRSYLYNIEDRR